MNTGQPKKLSVLGVTYLSDLYPNVKYKVELLKQSYSPQIFIYELGKGSFYKSSSGKAAYRKLMSAWHLFWGHLRVFFSSVRRPARTVYICYPGIFILLLYTLVPKRRRPTLVLDAFISLYDTIVLDRGLLAKSSLLARGLYRIERKAFRTANFVVTDTDSSSRFLGDLFDIPATRFASLPLAIPPECSIRIDAPWRERPEDSLEEKPLSLLFMGSMVPLQGISVILEAASLLRDIPAIRFVMIGDGQDAHLVDAWLNDARNNNLVWHREMLSTSELIEQIRCADICLGIFGSTPKTERVIPYKIYYYAAQGKPFLTLRTDALINKADNSLLCSAGAEALASRLSELQKDPRLVSVLAHASDNLYRSHLSQDMLREKISSLFDSINSPA